MTKQWWLKNVLYVPRMTKKNIDHWTTDSEKISGDYERWSLKDVWWAKEDDTKEFFSQITKHLSSTYKLQDNSEIVIFVDYHPTGAYKLYDHIKGKVEVGKYMKIIKQEQWAEYGKPHVANTGSRLPALRTRDHQLEPTYTNPLTSARGSFDQCKQRWRKRRVNQASKGKTTSNTLRRFWNL